MASGRLPEPDGDVHRLPVADDGDAGDVAGTVLLDLGQELLEGVHPFVVDGDDQVGGVGVEERRMMPGPIRSTRSLTPWMPACSAGPPSTSETTSRPLPVARNRRIPRSARMTRPFWISWSRIRAMR